LTNVVHDNSISKTKVGKAFSFKGGRGAELPPAFTHTLLPKIYFYILRRVSVLFKFFDTNCLNDFLVKMRSLFLYTAIPNLHRRDKSSVRAEYGALGYRYETVAQW